MDLLELPIDGTLHVHLHQTGCQENDRVDKTDDPAVTTTTIDSKLLRERQVGTVRSSLVPTLCSSSNSAECDRVPEHLGTMPFVVAFVDQRSALGLGKTSKLFEARLIACNECSIAEELCMLGHAILFCELTGIGNHLLWRFALERRQALVGVLEDNGWGVSLAKPHGMRPTCNGFSTMFSATEARRPAVSLRSTSCFSET